LQRILVIFDLDGTLYKTEEVSVPALKKAFSKFGIELTEEDILQQFGEPTDKIIRNLTPEGKKDRFDEIKKEIAKNEAEMIPMKGELYLDVKKMLKDLKELGCDLAVCSNGREDYIKIVLSTTSIDDIFLSIKSYTDGKSKSDHIKELLEEYEPDAAAMVGDRYHDIEAAEEADILSIGARYGYGGDEVLEADEVVMKPSQIAEIVKKKMHG